MVSKKEIKRIKEFCGSWVRGDFSLKRLGGQTNTNWLLEFPSGKFFVRLPWEREDVVNRKVEGKNILAITRNRVLRKITPRFFLYVLNKRNILNPKDHKRYDAPNGTMVAEYIDGEEFTFSHFRKPLYQKKLARMFCVFHKSNVQFVNSYNVFRDEIQKYRVAAKKHDISKLADSKTVAFFERVEREAEQALPSLQEGISTHNDFIFQNFLVDKKGKLYLLDFEYAGFNKKGGISYDYGFLFADNLFRKPAMTKDLFETFLRVASTVYKKKLDRRQIYWAALAALLVQFWWGMVRYFGVASLKEKKYFKEYVQKRMRGASKLVRFLE
ncbi:MAG: phosphotransferase [Candidatus Wildermuthbacteria bacterium]|nr:phosphotransferase [Candidatus Wildermuthbacteria bacterium]